MAHLEHSRTDDHPGRADYGIDAPGVIRNLVVIALVSLVIWLLIVAHIWSGVLRIPIGDDALVIECIGLAQVTFGICVFMTCWMIYDSKVGKQKLRDHLVESLGLKGSESVLDLGCGRGLLLIGAAKRLTTGTATGIDLWQNEDLSGNSAEALLRNAKAEGVADRIRIETGDMRHMPFASGQFDAILSRAAIHNLYKPDERLAALSEVLRVLKPGGVALIDDIRHIGAYQAFFVSHGCDVKRSGSRIMAFILVILTFGSLCPGQLRISKPA
jgi:SAM-dependent methyltransferase